jgi:hypothetical protein
MIALIHEGVGTYEHLTGVRQNKDKEYWMMEMYLKQMHLQTDRIMIPSKPNQSIIHKLRQSIHSILCPSSHRLITAIRVP